jgi:hypothetical protein
MFLPGNQLGYGPRFREESRWIVLQAIYCVLKGKALLGRRGEDPQSQGIVAIRNLVTGSSYCGNSSDRCIAIVPGACLWYSNPPPSYHEVRPKVRIHLNLFEKRRERIIGTLYKNAAAATVPSLTTIPFRQHVERLRLHISRASAACRHPCVVLGAKAVEELPTVSPRTKGVPAHRKLTGFSAQSSTVGRAHKLGQTIR